jgi:hypothetical protein
MAYLTDEAVTEMAGAITKRDAWMAAQKKKAKEREHELRAIVGVAAGTLAFSYADAAWSDDGVEWKLFGVPVAAAAALALHGIGWAGYGGRYTNDLHNAGTGALAVWLGQFGREWGGKSRSKPIAHHATAGYGTGALPGPGQRYVVTDMPGVPAYGG